MYDTFITKFATKEKKLLITYVVLILIMYSLQNIYISNVLSKIYASIKSAKTDELKKRIYTLCIVTFIIILGYILKNKLEMRLIPNFNSVIRQTLFKNTLEANAIKYTDIPLGKYNFHSVRTSTAFKDLFGNTINTSRIFLVSVIIIVYLLFKYPNIGIILLVSFLISINLCTKVKDQIDIHSKKNEMFADIQEKLQESMYNIDNIILNNQTEHEVKKHKEIIKDYTELSELSYKLFNRFYMKFATILFITFVALYYTLFKKHKKDFIFLSILIMIYYSTQLEFLNKFFDCIYNMGNLDAEEKFFRKVFEIPEDKKKFIGIKFDNIKFKDIDFSYDGNKQLYNNFSLEINPMDKVLLYGKSGRGKTTLMKLLLKFYTPSKGDIIISGQSVKDIDNELLRNKITYVNQKTVLFNDTILNNIKYGNNIKDETIIELLKKYELYDMLKDKLYEDSGIYGGQLSFGMQKVVITLRGLLKGNYDTIILDEPTASLDMKTKEKLMDLVKDITKDKTVIIISHDPFVEKYSTKVIDI